MKGFLKKRIKYRSVMRWSLLVPLFFPYSIILFYEKDKQKLPLIKDYFFYHTFTLLLLFYTIGYLSIYRCFQVPYYL